VYTLYRSSQWRSWQGSSLAVFAQNKSHQTTICIYNLFASRESYTSHIALYGFSCLLYLTLKV